MILHIVHDDKFIDGAYQIFENARPGNNIFILITYESTRKYIKTTPVKTISKRELLSPSFIDSLKQYDMVVVHYLDHLRLRLIARASKSVKFVWLGWGGDYYDLITGDTRNLLMPLTYRLFDNQKIKKVISVIKDKIKELFFIRVTRTDVLNKISFFVPVLFEDYLLLKSAVPEFLPKYLSWSYATLEDDLIKGVEGFSVSGDNILIGNSASYTSNHLDAFNLLKTVELSEKKIYCPLSYGEPLLRQHIITCGHEIYSEKFFPLIDFLPYEEYVKLISSCSLVIMNHLRQQALGNVVIMLYLGAKVFLNEKNPVYRFFKNEGAFVFTMDEFAFEYTSRLDNSSIEHNRNVLKRNWSREVVILKTKKLIETVESYEIS